MQYFSTRGGIAPIGFTQAVMMGLATDGGLLVPTTIPHLDAATLQRWSQLRFQDLALEVMTLFIGEEISQAELKHSITRSYANFTHPEITPLVRVGDLQILELFHGPLRHSKMWRCNFLVIYLNIC